MQQGHIHPSGRAQLCIDIAILSAPCSAGQPPSCLTCLLVVVVFALLFFCAWV